MNQCFIKTWSSVKHKNTLDANTCPMRKVIREKIKHHAIVLKPVRNHVIPTIFLSNKYLVVYQAYTNEWCSVSVQKSQCDRSKGLQLPIQSSCPPLLSIKLTICSSIIISLRLLLLRYYSFVRYFPISCRTCVYHFLRHPHAKQNVCTTRYVLCE